MKKRELTGGPGLSAGEREREGKGEEAGWAWPRKRKGGAGQVGQAGRKKGRGEKVSIFFSKYIFLKLIFQKKFEFKTLYKKIPHIT